MPIFLMYNFFPSSSSLVYSLFFPNLYCNTRFIIFLSFLILVYYFTLFFHSNLFHSFSQVFILELSFFRFSQNVRSLKITSLLHTQHPRGCQVIATNFFGFFRLKKPIKPLFSLFFPGRRMLYCCYKIVLWMLHYCYKHETGSFTRTTCFFNHNISIIFPLLSIKY